MIKFLAACAALIGLAVIVACSTSTTPASAGGGNYGWTQLDGGNSPYDYPTVAFICHGLDGVYISSFANSGATAGGGVFVVRDDPECGARP